jgi:hypothetical protein
MMMMSPFRMKVGGRQTAPDDALRRRRFRHVYVGPPGRQPARTRGQTRREEIVLGQKLFVYPSEVPRGERGSVLSTLITFRTHTRARTSVILYFRYIFKFDCLPVFVCFHLD